MLRNRLHFPTFLKRTDRSRALLFITLFVVGLTALIFRLKGFTFTNNELISLSLLGALLFIFQRYTRSVLQQERDWAITILDTINEAIITTDEKGIITFMNPEAQQLTRWNADTAIGLPLNEVLVLKNFKTNRPVITSNRLVARTISEPAYAFLHRKHGSIVPVLQHAAPIKTNERIFVGSIRIFRDISNRIEYQVELEKRKRAFETLVENANDIITRHDTQHRYLYVNRETERITGRARKEFIGKTFKDVINNKIAVETLTAGLDYVYAQRKMYITEYRTVTSEGLRYFHSRFVPEFDRNKVLTSVLIISRDITELKLLSERKDEFIAMASHEFKTPLTSIKVFTQLLEKRHNNKLSAKYFGAIHEQLGKLTHFIGDMLDVTKIQSGKLDLYKEPFPVTEMVEKTIMVIRAISPEHAFKVNNKSTATTIVGDRERIEQVLVNLLNNAVKYSPGGTSIELTVSNDKSTFTMSVKDFGIGISKTEQKRIFERFYRVYSPGERIPGLGIGLFISYEIVRQHGGSMWVESEKGKGSTFFIKLPMG